jgi:hypothetical protein
MKKKKNRSKSTGGKVNHKWVGKVPDISVYGVPLWKTIPGRRIVVEDFGKVFRARVLGPGPEGYCYVEYPSEEMTFYTRLDEIEKWESKAKSTLASKGRVPYLLRSR